MGQKYIIELEEPEIFDDRKFYICSQMPWWAVSENIVENLTPYTEPDMEKIRKEAYEQGLSDAWEMGRKIAISEESGGLTCREMQRIFCTDEIDEIFDMSASEAIEKIRQHEQEQEEQIQVGDEVISPDGKAVVTEISDRNVRIMYSNGSGYVTQLEELTKAGRHFPEIAAVLAKMKEES